MSLLINNALLMGVHYNYPSEALYTFAEANSKIINDGYIPIANADELNNLRNTVSQEMGLRTPWQGTYVTGIDKKYIQVLPLNMNNIRNFAIIGSASPYFTGIFDGNELLIDNLYCASNGLFLTNLTAIIKNSRVNLYDGLSAFGSMYNGTIDNCQATIYNISISSSIKGGIITNMINGTINNCKTYGNIITNGACIGGIIGLINEGIITNCESNLSIESDCTKLGGLIGHMSTGTISNSIANGNIIVTNGTTAYGFGGFVGQMDNGEITKCISNGNVTGTINNGDVSTFGGFVGYMVNGTISKCFSTGNVNAANRTGEFCSVLQNGTISNCYSLGNVNETNGTNSINGSAGFICRVASGSITNCYSTGKVTGVNVTKGFCAINSGTITNSYWDTITSKQSTSNGGTGKTTTEMQEGSIPDTTIYVNWDDTIWDENTTNEYPTLK